MESFFRDEIASVFDLIADDLGEIEKIMVATSTGQTSFLTESATYLTRAGGKRVRAALAVFAAQLGTGAQENVYKTAAAIEMVHLATLYHDDVIDESDLRRGVPTAHQRWGNTVAILAGDFLFARASALAAEVGKTVSTVLADAIAFVVQGQVAELEATYDAKRTSDHYFQTIQGKTASLLEACTRLGSALAGCSPDVVESMRRFGTAFGYAFQIADDLLDLAASEEELGKPPGTDLRDGVYTLPVLLGVGNDPGIRDQLGGPEVDVDLVRREIVSNGAFVEAREIAAGYVKDALEELAKLPPGEARASLEKLTRLVVDRVPTP